MAKVRVRSWSCICERCRWSWISRTATVPILCPRCGSAQWQTPKADAVPVDTTGGKLG